MGDSFEYHGITIGTRHLKGRLSCLDIAFFLCPAKSAFTYEALCFDLGIDPANPESGKAAVEALCSSFLAKPEPLRSFILSALRDISVFPSFSHFNGIFDILRTNSGEGVLCAGKAADLDLKDLFSAITSNSKKTPIRLDTAEIPDDKIDEIYEEILRIKSKDGFRKRNSQIQLSREINTCIGKGNCLVIEAPTGTGKTIGYLIPAILHSYYEKQPIFISTFTRSLQMQVYKKDLNFLRDIIPVPSASVLFGRENYPCILKIDLLNRGRTELLGNENDAVIFFGIVSQYLDSFIEESLPSYIFPEGVVTENEFSQIFFEICARKEDCPSRKCRFFKECPYFNAVADIKRSNIVIVNHWNLISYIAEGEFKNIKCIIDEADKFPDAAANVYSSELNNFLIFRFLRGISYAKKNSVKTFEQLFYQIKGIPYKEKREALAGIRKDVREIRSLLLEPGLGGDRSEVNLYDAIGDPIHSSKFAFLRKLALSIESLILKLAGIQKKYEEELQKELYANIKLVNAIENMTYCLDTIRKALNEDAFVEGTEFVAIFRVNVNGWDLDIVPVLVSGLLNELFYPKMASMVHTSATISVGGTPEYFSQLSGIDDFDWKQLNSPFDLKNQMRIMIMNNIPAYSFGDKDGFRRSCAETLKDLIGHFKGRLMILFTSYDDMQYTYDALNDGSLSSSLLLQKQGIWYREYINERFRTSPDCVLFGVKAYWYGVDFPGELLKYLIIYKLPYLPPADILVKKRGALIEDYVKKEAQMAFKQAVGRLIRTETDKGGVFILDKRVLLRDNYETFIKEISSDIAVDTATTESAIRYIDEFLL